MKRTLGTLALFVAVFWSNPSHAVSLKVDFDPGLYVLWNHLVIEGTLISHGSVEPRDWSNHKRFTNEGSIVVRDVLHQVAGLVVAVGDTVVFSYPHGHPISENDNYFIWSEHPGSPKELTLMSQGLFTLKASKWGYLPGHWFVKGDEHRRQIEEFIEGYSANPEKVVADLKKRRPGFRLNFRYPRNGKK